MRNTRTGENRARIICKYYNTWDRLLSDPSSATRPAGRVDCNRSAMAGKQAVKLRGRKHGWLIGNVGRRLRTPHVVVGLHPKRNVVDAVRVRACGNSGRGNRHWPATGGQHRETAKADDLEC